LNYTRFLRSPGIITLRNKVTRGNSAKCWYFKRLLTHGLAGGLAALRR